MKIVMTVDIYYLLNECSIKSDAVRLGYGIWDII